MKKTISEYEFIRAFEDYDRVSNFPNTLPLLYEYLTDLEDDTGEEIELDVIGLCCDFEEIDLKEIAEKYEIDIEQVREILEENGAMFNEKGGHAVIHCGADHYSDLEDASPFYEPKDR